MNSATATKILFACIFLLLFLGTANAATMTTASRTSCVAPCAVFFDAVNTTTPDVWNSGVVQPSNGDYASYYYKWNFGDDPNAVWWTDGKKKNQATNYVAGHVYENTGTYIASLDITDTAGQKHSYEQQITVQAFSGTTYYVSSSSGSDSYDGLCPTHVSGNCGPFASFSKGMSMAGTNKRILFKRTDSWTTGTTSIISAQGPGIIGAYYNSDGSDDATKAKPIIQFSGSNSPLFRIGPGVSDWRLMDLDLRGPNVIGSAAGAIHIGLTGVSTPTSRFLALRISAQYFTGAVITRWGNNDNPETFIVDSSFPGNGMYIAGYHLAVLGVSSTALTDGEHVLRVWHARKSLIAHNILMDPKPSKHSLKFHNEKGVNPPPAKYNIIAYNKFRGDGWSVAYGPQDEQSNESMEDAVFEGNEFLYDTGVNAGLILSARHVTVRNNVFNMNGGSNPVAVSILHRGIEPAPADIRIIGNTAGHATADTQSQFVHISSDATNILLRNNLAVWTYPGSEDFQGLVVTDSGFNLGELDSEYNLWFSPSPGPIFAWVGYTMYRFPAWQALGKDTHSLGVNPLLVNVNTGDLHLQTSSPPRDKGTQAPVFEDFDGNPRPSPVNGAYDIGAFEFQSGASQCVTLPILLGYIAEWKTGNRTMQKLLTDIAAWKTGENCP